MGSRFRLLLSFGLGILGAACLAGSLVALASSGAIPLQSLLPSAANAGVPTSPRPTPLTENFNGCPGEGDAEDIELNRRKNRVDQATWQPVELSALLGLVWSKGIEGRHMDQWRAQDRAEVMIHNGVPIQTEGFVIQAKANGPEGANCYSRTLLTSQIWLVQKGDDPLAKSIVAAVSPRALAGHKEWTVENLQKLAQRKSRIRISGWTLINPEHPAEIGKTTSTLWEIHPVTAIDVQDGKAWKTWDGG